MRKAFVGIALTTIAALSYLTGTILATEDSNIGSNPSDACFTFTMVGPRYEDEIPEIFGYTITNIIAFDYDVWNVTYC